MINFFILSFSLLIFRIEFIGNSLQSWPMVCFISILIHGFLFSWWICLNSMHSLFLVLRLSLAKESFSQLTSRSFNSSSVVLDSFLIFWNEPFFFFFPWSSGLFYFVEILFRVQGLMLEILIGTKYFFVALFSVQLENMISFKKKSK